MVGTANNIQNTSYSLVLGWIIPLAPLLAAILNWLFGIHRRKLSHTLAIGALLCSFLCSVWLLSLVVGGVLPLPIEFSLEWISLPSLHIPFGILLDRFSLLMALVVTGVGSAIFIYSTGYMANDHAYSRYFGLLSLFAFSMLTIVLANNWIQLFIGWELVGFSSYALIGHWYAKPSAAEAGKKAFMVNRVADFGFFMGILSLWAISSPVISERTFCFSALELRLPILTQGGLLPSFMLPLIGLLIFCGPIGKSAQFPLHVWLPDAMEGPTPVSALIHAATMVAAGVYLLCRAFWLFEGIPAVMNVIMWIGVATAFLSACLALVENDLKRILAYSTLSQLGYMVMALGLGGRVEGMYHLTTHAFFKALLFLAAGSVIHSTHQQDIWKLGGLWRSMRWTSLAFLIGGLSLCGIPGFSGFFSKDAILLLSYKRSHAVYWLATATAALSAFYIARAWFVAFSGVPRDHSHTGSELHRHESPPVMLWPLFLLSVLSVSGGYLGIAHFLGESHGKEELHAQFVPIVSLIFVFGGILLAWLIYKRGVFSTKDITKRLASAYTLLKHRYYFDDIYGWYIENVQQKIVAGSCAWFERVIIIGVMVNGTAALVRVMGETLRLCQNGKIQTYVLVFLLGVIFLLASRAVQ